MSDSRLNSIAMELSVIDKAAVVQKDKKGRILTDPTTKDTEIIRYCDVQAAQTQFSCHPAACAPPR